MHAMCEDARAYERRWTLAEAMSMVLLRATQKVLRLLPESAGGVIDSSTTALGDWYVNRLIVDRQPLLLLVSSTSRLAAP
jgi:hypothetical protein